MHADFPIPVLKDPALHLVQVVDILTPLYSPAEQFLQRVAFSAEYVPAMQNSVHDVFLPSIEEYFPGSHAGHVELRPHSEL